MSLRLAKTHSDNQMVDFRTKKEILRDRERSLAENSALAAREAESRFSQIEQRIDQLANSTAAMQTSLAQTNADSAETRQVVAQKVDDISADIQQVHEMIRASGESDMQLIAQMNENYERRLGSIMKLISEL